MGTALLLTGSPGAGKTTVIRSVVAELGARAGGFYTTEIRERGRRVGFRIVTLDGATGMLAGVNVPSSCRVGRYRVDLNDLDGMGVEAVCRAVTDKGVDVVVIDEIGKMELCSEAFRASVLAALESEKVVLATVMVAPHPWIDAIKARQRVTVVEVTTRNREEVPGQILRRLREMMEASASA